MSIDQRFGGVARLYGQAAFERLRSSSVAVVGIGGVGSWTAEALARSGVGCIILMDMDDLCVTNTNRQVHAMVSTIGEMKTEAMARRMKDICPETEVECLPCFYTEANEARLFDLKPDVVVDAIDSMGPKAHLIASCFRRGVPVVCCGGAGGRRDAGKVELDDLSRTKGDALLSKLRRRLKADYGLPLGERAKKLGIPCVFSQERAVFPTCEGGISDKRDSSLAGRMGCDAGFGSATHITGVFGFFAAGAVIEELIKDKQGDNN